MRLYIRNMDPIIHQTLKAHAKEKNMSLSEFTNLIIETQLANQQMKSLTQLIIDSNNQSVNSINELIRVIEKQTEILNKVLLNQKLLLEL